MLRHGISYRYLHLIHKNIHTHIKLLLSSTTVLLKIRKYILFVTNIEKRYQKEEEISAYSSKLVPYLVALFYWSVFKCVSIDTRRGVAWFIHRFGCFEILI